AGDSLVVPLVFARVRVERDDRAEEQVVAAPGAAHLLVPRRAVPRADQNLVELGVVGEAVPGIAAAAVGPPLTFPGLGGHLLSFVLEAVGGIARNDVEAPDLLSGLGIVGRDVAARRAVLRAAVADEDLPAKRLRVARDVQRLRHVGRLRRPALL